VSDVTYRAAHLALISLTASYASYFSLVWNPHNAEEEINKKRVEILYPTSVLESEAIGNKNATDREALELEQAALAIRALALF